MASSRDKDIEETKLHLHKAIKEGDAETVKRLLKMGASPNAVDSTDGRTPLTNACKCGHLEIVRILLDAGAQVNRKDRFKDCWGKDASQVPLAAACDRAVQDHSSVLSISRLLLEYGADVLSAHVDGTNGPLHFAAKYGHVEAVSLLLGKGVDVNIKGSYGQMALHHVAAFGKSLDLMRILLERGAQVNAEYQQGSNALFNLISGDEDNVDIARLLIDKGVKLQSEGLGGALYWAARCGKKQIVELLIARGMDVDSRDYKNEEIAIIGAMERKHYDVVKLLLEHGADPDAEHRYDGSLLRQAAEVGDQDLVKLILEKKNENKTNEQKTRHGVAMNPKSSKPKPKSTGALAEAAEKGNLAIVKLLVDSGVDINEQSGERKGNPLMVAAAFGKIEVLTYLLEKGADIAARDSKGSTALLYAASAGEDGAARILLEHGAPINEKNHLNWNAIMQACFKGHYNTAKLLLERGSPTDEIDREKGVTALWLAKHSGNANLVKLLEDHGAKERPIRLRKSDEPYFDITECDICAYLPPREEMAHDYSPESIEGLETIYSERGGEYKVEETNMIKKCVHCGTYYHHYHYIDTEDPIGGLIPTCSHHILRYNLLFLHALLRKLDKLDELTEAEARYQPTIDTFLRLVEAGHDFMPYVRPFVVESLVDYFVINNDWDRIKNVLLNEKNPAICVETVQDLLAVWGERFREDRFPPFSQYRNFTSDVQQKLKPLLQEHKDELVDIIKHFKIENSLEVAKVFANTTLQQKP